MILMYSFRGKWSQLELHSLDIKKEVLRSHKISETSVQFKWKIEYICIYMAIYKYVYIYDCIYILDDAYWPYSSLILSSPISNFC